MVSGEVITFKYHPDTQAPNEIRESGITIEAGKRKTLSEVVNVDGYIRAIAIYVPESARNLVGFRLFLENTQIFPSTGYFRGAFNGFIPLYYEVSKDSKLYLEVFNLDSEDHFIQVSVVVYPKVEIQI